MSSKAQHRLVLVQQAENYVEWQCPVCDRHVRVGFDGSGLEILNPGDKQANHGSASIGPGFALNDASVEIPTIH